MRKSVGAAGVALAMIAALASAAPAAADNLTFSFVSNYPYTVQLEFYSQNYSRAWPGGGKAYVLDDSKTHTYSLSCQTGEKVCWGAWSAGNPDTYWGSGPDDEHGCTNCCYTCGSSNPRPQELH